MANGAEVIVKLVALNAPSLVSNTHQQYGAEERIVGRDTESNKVFRRAIGFHTGSDPAGYTLWSVDARVAEFEAGSSPRVTVRRANPWPAAELCSLSNPAPLRSGVPYNSEYVPTVIINTGAMNTFTALGGCLLDADTAYFVMFEETAAGTRYRLKVTRINNEDSGGLSGWTIGEVAYRQRIGRTTWRTEEAKLHIAIKGTVGNTLSQGQQALEPLTVALEDLPESHNGSDAFTVRLAFTDEVALDEAGLRAALLVSNGSVTGVSSVSADLWDITITPTGNANVQLLLSPTSDCAATGAICTDDGRMLSAGLGASVPFVPQTAQQQTVTPLTAAFSAVPAEHDGSSRFTVGLAFSEDVKAGTRKVKAALDVTGGTVKRARRVAPPGNEQWTIAIEPDGHGAVSVLLPATSDCDATGAICTADGRKLSGGVAVQIAGPPGLSVADAQVQEGPGAELAFAVTLDRAASGTVTVGYMTANGTATAGEDYTAASGMLTFAAGETAKTVTVAVLDDAHDEGSETLNLVLMNPSGAYLADGMATGTIENTDPMPKAWMVRLGRTVGSQAVDALTQRLDGAASSHITVAGINIIGAPGVAPELEADDPFALPEWAKAGALEPEARTITGEDLVLRSAFHLSGGAANGEGTAFTAWGRVATGGFEAQVDDVTMDGNVTTGLVGFDAEWERLLAGVMLSHSEGEGSYRLDPSQGDDAGTVDSSLTGVYPYARMELNERVSAWALAGVGSGELTLHREGHQSMRTDLSMRMGALGVKGRVLDGGRDGVSVNVKSDAMWVGMENERTSDMVGTQGDVTRLRLIVEGERAYAVGEGATFTPSAEIGVRHDGGDAETGTGVEVGAGLRYTAGPLTIEGRVRTLVAHEARGYEEWGASGAIRVSPGASGRGLTLSIAPAWGRTGSATEQLWSARDASMLGADEEFEAASRLEMEAGYGFGLARNRGVLTPYAGATLGDGGSRTVRSGVRWTLGSELAVTAEATRNESAGAETADEVRLRAALRF